jgi:hypothetical protein
MSAASPPADRTSVGALPCGSPSDPLQLLQRLEALELQADLDARNIAQLREQNKQLDDVLSSERARGEKHAEAFMRIARTCDDRVDELKAQHAAAVAKLEEEKATLKAANTTLEAQVALLQAQTTSRIDIREQRLDDRDRRLDERERRLEARERRADDSAGSGGAPQPVVVVGQRDQPEWSYGTVRVSIATSDGAFYLRLESRSTVDELKTKLARIVGIPKPFQRIDVDDTVDDLKARLQSVVGIPKAHQRIDVDDGKMLRHCGVEENSTLHLTDLADVAAVPNRKFPLHIRTLTEETIQVNVAGHMRIERVKFLVWLRSDIVPEQQRLIFAGKQLEEGRTVADYRLSPGAVLHVVMRLGGDIGVWGAAENGPGAQVLRGVAPPTAAACVEVRASLLTGPLAAADPPVPAAIAEPLLDARECEALCRAADAAITAAETASVAAGCDAVALDGGATKVLLRRTPGVKGAATDWQVELTPHTVAAHVGAEALAGLKSALGAVAHRFVVRRVDAGTGVEAIPFHTDYARRTLQVPLNAPLVGDNCGGYVGGDVVYAVEGGFLKLPRRQGHGVVHDGAVPHGVTPLLRGRRYGLCVLHDPHSR